MEMKKLKVATARMAGYTGVLGRVRFSDGVSEEYLPRHIRDRMAAAMEFIEIDADGNEEPAGAQHRLIRDNRERAPKMEELARQTEGEKTQELTHAVLEAVKTPVLETRATLEAIADTGGIKALREIGVKWGVKHRSIPTLIEMILDAQEKGVAARNKRLADKVTAENERLKTTAPVSDIEPVAPVAVEIVDGKVSKMTADAADKVNEALKAAAASGDIAAAVSTTEASQE